MAQDLKASVSFVGDGTTTKFYFGFDYISKQFIKVAVGTDDTILSYPTDYTVNDKEVEFVEAPAKDTPIRIYRQTDSSRIIEWSDGSFIKASQMTLENVQQLHLIEESQDYVIINGMSKYPDGVNFNALGARVINVADPKEPQDAVTKHYMETVQGGFVSQNTALVEQATTQATNAKNSASSSATSASQSASSASASETSNQYAKKWAESTDSPDNQSDTDSTTGKTQSSRSWALYSKTKAQEAATSATNAKSSETNAKTSETNAKTSETKAAVSEVNAKTSETNAKSSETKSKDSENAARMSEQNAAESAKIATEYGGDFNMLKRNKTYSVGDIAYSPSLPSWAYLECTIAGTTGASEPDFSSVSSTGGAIADMADGNVHWRVRDTRCRYEVGDIIAKMTTPKSYEYLLPCNGSAFDKTKYPMLAKIFTTGNVPNLTDGRFLEGSASAGISKNAGLPNIIGSFKICGLSKGGLDSQDGAFSDGGVTYGDVCAKNDGYPDGYKGSGIGYFDASRYNSIYGLSDTVQPKSYTVQYYVCYGG